MNNWVSPEDWLATNDPDSPIEKCSECNSTGIKYHPVFGNVMCVCGHRVCDKCKGYGYLIDSINQDKYTCYRCDGRQYLVLQKKFLNK